MNRAQAVELIRQSHGKIVGLLAVTSGGMRHQITDSPDNLVN